MRTFFYSFIATVIGISIGIFSDKLQSELWNFIDGNPVDRKLVFPLLFILFLLAIIGGLIAKLTEQNPTSGEPNLALLVPTTSTEIKQKLTNHGQIKWIDRDVTSFGTLRRHPRLAITGISGIGKTREAVELIERALSAGLITEDAIFQLGEGMKTLKTKLIRNAALKLIKPPTPLLLFIDDLPYHFSEIGEKSLSELLKVVAKCKPHYILLTASSEYLQNELQQWLEKQDFYQLPLGKLTPIQSDRLVEKTSVYLQLDLATEVNNIFGEQSESTPALIWLALKQLQHEGKCKINKADTKRVILSSLAETWAENYRHLVATHPAVESLHESICHFRSTNVRLARSLVLAYAHYLLPQHSAGKLTDALKVLEHYGLNQENELLLVPDTMLDKKTDAEKARNQLTKFLSNYCRWLHNRWLRRFHRYAEVQQWAVFDLALNAQKYKDLEEAVRLYSIGLQISPRSQLYNSRGNAYYILKKYAAAIADFDQAIALDSNFANAYNNRGIARSHLKDYTAAITDFNQAIALDSNFANAYNNRGVARSHLKDYTAAISDFNQAIDLNPNFTKAYNNLNQVYHSLKG